ncbi:MAG: hypothetical protein HY301_10935 [Verrucomicrobia bacterium]|nr:hypothetical protein [Verrucomicrobiota bacterium]
MKLPQFIICSALCAVALILAVVLYVTGKSTQNLQLTLTQQQEDINRGSTSLQVGNRLLNDVVQVAGARSNMALVKLLQDNGYPVQFVPRAATNAPAAGTPK